MKNKKLRKFVFASVLALVIMAGAGLFLFIGIPPPQVERPVSPPVKQAVARPSVKQLMYRAPVTLPTTSTPAPSPAPSSIPKPATAAPPAPKVIRPAAADDVRATPPTYASSILKAEPFDEMAYHIQSTPNDPFAAQWFSTNIEADLAWDITSTNSTVLAIIDTGFALDHEDFANRWAINAGEQGFTSDGDRCWTGVAADKQTNDCDDDHNGYVDDWRGWDFDDNTNNPQTGKHNPAGQGITHGTNVAGLAAATGNNAKGVAGMNWNAKIMPIKAMSDDGSGYTSNVVAAIQYAVDNGATVINLSLGGPAYDDTLETAVNYAESHGVTVVAAAGNCAASSTGSCSGTVAPGRMLYPALFTNVIAAGAVTSANARASFSSYGSKLDLVAPGSSISYSTSWSNGNQTAAYASNISGTSFASPIIAGVASLVKANAPGLQPFQIRDILAESTDKPTAMGGQNYTNEYGYGKVNAFKAVADARARQDLLTIAGTTPTKNNAPTVHAAYGQSGGRAVRTTDNLPVYCLSTPSVPCTIQLTNQSTQATRTLEIPKTDSIGVGFVRTGPLAAGTWQVIAIDSDLASAAETIIVQ